MKFYRLAYIDAGGYIRLSTNGTCVHRESTLELQATSTFLGFDTAKAVLESTNYTGRSDNFILSIGDEGLVEELWVTEALHEQVSQRLKIWSGCYGSWPIRRLNGGSK